MNYHHSINLESHSESVLGELSVNLSEGFVIESLGLGGGLLLLGLEVLLRLGESLLLEGSGDVSLGPSVHGSELSDSASFSLGLDSENLEGLGNDHSLLLIIGEGNSLEDLQSLEGSSTSGRFMGEHSSNNSPEHS